MKYALVKNGKVQNVILADAAFVATIAHEWDRIVPTSTAQIGWIDDGVNLSALSQPQPTRRDAILIRLMEIDATTDKPRTRRELQLNKASTKTWLQALEDEAVALRTELAGL